MSIQEQKQENRSNTSLDYFFKNLWDKRSQGLNLPDLDIFHTITSENIEYLLNLYPYIQIISTTAVFAEPVDVKFITIENGWTVQDYEEAMCVSIGKNLYMGGEYHSLYDNKSEEKHGTVTWQAINAAIKMAEMAQEKGWPGINIIDGTPIMCFTIWQAATSLGMTVEGFTPSKEDNDKAQRIKDSMAIMLSKTHA